MSYLGAIGDDPQADLITHAAAAAGVDTSHLIRVPGPTGRTVVARDQTTGERQFVSEDYGVAASYRLDERSASAVAAHRWGHFSRQADLAEWAPRLRAEGTKLSCDLGVEGGAELLGKLAPLLDTVFLSDSAGGVPGEKLLERALLAGAPLAVVTLGARGSIAAAGADRWRSDAVPVATVVDSLGAGDASIAAFIAGRLSGDTVPDALAAGARAGAEACMRLGVGESSAGRQGAGVRAGQPGPPRAGRDESRRPAPARRGDIRGPARVGQRYRRSPASAGTGEQP